MCWYLLCWRHWTRSTSIRCNFSPRHIFKACVWRRKRNNLAQQSQKWIWISVSFLLMQETWNERKEGEGRCGHLWWTAAWWLIRMAKEENETLMVHTISRVSVCMCVCVCVHFATSLCNRVCPCVNDVTTDVSIRNIGVRRYTVSAHSSWIPAVPLLLLFHSLLWRRLCKFHSPDPANEFYTFT